MTLLLIFKAANRFNELLDKRTGMAKSQLRLGGLKSVLEQELLKVVR